MGFKLMNSDGGQMIIFVNTKEMDCGENGFLLI